MGTSIELSGNEDPNDNAWREESVDGRRRVRERARWTIRFVLVCERDQRAASAALFGLYLYQQCILVSVCARTGQG